MSAILCTVDWERLVRVSTALLTPLIGVVATYIAIQQYIINRRQYRLALFEKRMAVFNSTMNLIAAVAGEGKVEHQKLFTMLRETRDHNLLFGPEIGDFINQVYKKGLEINARIQVGGQDNLAKTFELQEWFAAQSAVAREKFLKYLDFRQP
jgi:hypothetical protein